METPNDCDAVRLERVTKSYGETVAVSDISFALERGRTLAILGPSGCGKTTILRLIGGFIAPDDGEVQIAGNSMKGVRPYERNVGIVFQDYALFPHMTVAQNVAYPLRWRAIARDEQQSRTADLLKLVRLTGYETRRPAELSGGQQQRVALARALASRPEVLLLDEPLSALDAKLRVELRVEIKEILKSVGATCIVVTHDQEEAMSLADDLIVMNRGRIEQRGQPGDLYRRPRSRFVAEFIGKSNLFQGVVGADGTVTSGDALSFRLSGPREPQQVIVCIRPEHMTVRFDGIAGTSGNSLPGILVDVVDLGSEREIVVAVGSRRLVNVIDRERRSEMPAKGAPCQVHFQPEDCIVLPDE